MRSPQFTLSCNSDIRQLALLLIQRKKEIFKVVLHIISIVVVGSGFVGRRVIGRSEIKCCL